jgi:hypothetical protein
MIGDIVFPPGAKGCNQVQVCNKSILRCQKILEAYIARVPMKSEVFDSAYKGLNECVEAIIMTNPGKTIAGDIACTYNNSVLRLAIQYPGSPLDLAAPEPDISNLDDSANVAQLEVFLMKHYADRVLVESNKRCSIVSLFFEE